MSLLKKLSSTLPLRTQQSLKRLHFTRQIRAGHFLTGEPEYARLKDWISPGDWVMDVGANVGHYSVRLSQLVGPAGRVLAFEPVPDTFELLASNIATTGRNNVSLFNVAASEHLGLAGISLPKFSTGLTNYYMAGLTAEKGALDVLTLPLDTFLNSNHISLIKIDVEGHELQTLLGMRLLIQRHLPRLIVEGTSADVATLLAELGYRYFTMDASPNRVFEPA